MYKLFIISILGFLLTLPVKAQDVTVLVGATHGEMSSSGTWWQKEYPNTRTNNVPSVTLRYDFKTQQGNKYAVGATRIGHWTSAAEAVASDNAYDLRSPYPISHWYGDQTIDGVFAVKRQDYGKWSFEYGPMLTHTNWRMQIPDWVNCEDSSENEAGRALGGQCLIPQNYIWPLDIKYPHVYRLTWKVTLAYHFDKSFMTEVSCTDGRVLRVFPGIVNGLACTFNLGYTFK